MSVGNFLLHERTHDVIAPEWPHIVCDGGRGGFAWHDNPKKRRCFQGRTAADPETIAAVLRGRPIDRLWALRILLVGENEDDSRKMPGAIIVLFPAQCRGCLQDHTDAAVQWRRAALAIHPDAIDALRAADPSLRLLFDLDVPPDRRYKRRTRDPGMPIRGTPEETMRAQISWAYDLAARRECPIDTRKAG